MNKILRTKAFIASSVAVVTFIVFLPALQNEFVNLDDNGYVYENPFIRSLDVKLLKSAFWGFHVSNWHPLTWLSHAVDYSIWGLNPLGHHLTNIILHALATLTLVFLVMRLMEVLKKIDPIDATSKSFINGRTIMITGTTTGLLFGLHPLHVESVAWVAERKDLLCALFFLLSLSAYTKYVYNSIDRPVAENSVVRRFDKQYLYALSFFILALLSKPMAVSLPFILLIIDWYPFQRIRSLKTFRSSFIEKLPYIGLSLISSILTILAQNAGSSIVPIEAISISTRLLVASSSLINYLWKMLLPLHLIPFYPYPRDVSFLSLECFFSVIFTVAMTIICLFFIKKQKVGLSLWGYYVITLLPVLGIVQVGEQSMADRYTYLPSIGPFLMIGLSAAWLSQRVTTFKKWNLPARFCTFFVAVLLLGTTIYLTHKQIRVWKNSIDLWSYVIENEPWRVPRAYYNRGQAFAETGLFEKALADFNMAIALNPRYYKAYNNRGLLFTKMGQYDAAIRDYDTVIRLRPSDYPAYYNRGKVLEKIGQYRKASEDFAKAAELINNVDRAY